MHVDSSLLALICSYPIELSCLVFHSSQAWLKYDFHTQKTWRFLGFQYIEDGEAKSAASSMPSKLLFMLICITLLSSVNDSISHMIEL